MISIEQRSQLVGRRNRRVIRLGDKLQVQVAKVDSLQKAGGFPARQGRERRSGTHPKESRPRPKATMDARPTPAPGFRTA